MTAIENSESTKPAIGGIVRTGLIAAVVAIVVNALLFFIGSLFTFPDNALTPTGDPVTIVPVVVVTLFGGIAATVGYIVLTRFLAKATANRVMLIGGALVLIGMFFNPFSIENVPVAEIVILEIMHIVAAWPVWQLTR